MKCKIHGELNCEKCVKRKICMNCGRNTRVYAQSTWVCPECFAKRERRLKVPKTHCMKCGKASYGKMVCTSCIVTQGQEKSIMAFTSKGNKGVNP